MSLLSLLSEQIRRLSYLSILELTSKYPNARVFFVESEFYQFFRSIIIEQNEKISLFELGSAVEAVAHLSADEPIVVIGRPREILRMSKSIPPNPVVFATVPFRSVSLRAAVMQRSSLCFSALAEVKSAFIPRSRLGYVSLPIGRFNDIFFSNTFFEAKCLKTALELLDFAVGGFERVYGVGPVSSTVLPNFAETCTGGSNVLVAMDRIVDLMGAIKMNTTYIGALQEYGVLDEESECIVKLESLLQLMGKSRNTSGKISILNESDDIFNNCALFPLDVAFQQIRNIDIKTTEMEKKQQQHLELLQKLININKNTFFPEVFLKIQNQQKKYEPEVFGRSIINAPIDISYSFRLLSILHSNKSKGETSIARLIAAKYGVPSFAKWDRISESIKKQPVLPLADNVNPSLSFDTLLGSILSWILTDKRKGNNFPYKEFYCSSKTNLSKEKRKWFILIVGGLCISELFMFKYIARKCRPNDEFVFITTKMLNQNEFMREVIECD